MRTKNNTISFIIAGYVADKHHIYIKRGFGGRYYYPTARQTQLVVDLARTKAEMENKPFWFRAERAGFTVEFKF